MVDWFLQSDLDITLFLNSLGHPYLDNFMLFLSKKLVWLPLYIFIVFQIYRAYPKHYIHIIVGCVLTIILTDQATSSVMKPFFQRPRPCHDETLKYLIINVGNCGGKYGFASSHAANTMGLAVVLFLRNKMIIGRYLLPWALIVSYSRIYLGVHYVGDVVVGWLIALFAAIVVHYILNRSIQLSINYN